MICHDCRQTHPIYFRTTPARSSVSSVLLQHPKTQRMENPQRMEARCVRLCTSSQQDSPSRAVFPSLRQNLGSAQDMRGTSKVASSHFCIPQSWGKPRA